MKSIYSNQLGELFFKDMKASDTLDRDQFKDIVGGLGIEKKESDLLTGFLYQQEEQLSV